MIHTAESLQAAFKYLFVNEVPALKLLANMLPSSPVVVNLGAGAGTSGLAFMESREDLVLITVDITREANPFGSLESEYQVLMDAGFEPNTFTSRYSQLQIDSKILGVDWLRDKSEHDWDTRTWGWSKKQVDLVLIDGDHSYEGCSGDIQAWLPNIKSGGIIAVHDYRKSELYAHDEDFKDDAPHPKPWPGVDKAVDELLIPHYEQILRVDSLVAFRV